MILNNNGKPAKAPAKTFEETDFKALALGVMQGFIDLGEDEAGKLKVIGLNLEACQHELTRALKLAFKAGEQAERERSPIVKP